MINESEKYAKFFCQPIRFYSSKNFSTMCLRDFATWNAKSEWIGKIQEAIQTHPTLLRSGDYIPSFYSTRDPTAFRDFLPCSLDAACANYRKRSDRISIIDHRNTIRSLSLTHQNNHPIIQHRTSIRRAAIRKAAIRTVAI